MSESASPPTKSPHMEAIARVRDNRARADREAEVAALNEILSQFTRARTGSETIEEYAERIDAAEEIVVQRLKVLRAWP